MQKKKTKDIQPRTEIPSMNNQESLNLLNEIEQLTGMTPAAKLVTSEPSNKPLQLEKILKFVIIL